MNDLAILIQASSKEEASNALETLSNRLFWSSFFAMEWRTEFLGRPVQPTWVGMHGVPVQVWNEVVFRLLGNCIGRPLLVDSQTAQRNNLEVGTVKVFLNKSDSLPLFVGGTHVFCGD